MVQVSLIILFAQHFHRRPKLNEIETVDVIYIFFSKWTGDSENVTKSVEWRKNLPIL